MLDELWIDGSPVPPVSHIITEHPLATWSAGKYTAIVSSQPAQDPVAATGGGGGGGGGAGAAVVVVVGGGGAVVVVVVGATVVVVVDSSGGVTVSWNGWACEAAREWID